MSGSPATLDSVTAKRLDEIRGPAPRRSPNVRVLAAFAQHTDCRLATLGFTAGVDFDGLLARTRYQAPFGQSPFAIARGLSFERLLRERNYAATLELLRTVLSFPLADARIENLRDDMEKTRLEAARVQGAAGAVDTARLEAALGELALAVKTFQRIAVEKGLCTRDELTAKLRQIDLEDGREDGRSPIGR